MAGRKQLGLPQRAATDRPEAFNGTVEKQQAGGVDSHNRQAVRLVWIQLVAQHLSGHANISAQLLDVVLCRESAAGFFVVRLFGDLIIKHGLALQNSNNRINRGCSGI